MRYIAFLRAVNVGGRTVKMDRLRQVLMDAGLAEVRTVIASGNVWFDSRKRPDALERLIERALAGALGFDVATIVRTPDDLGAVVALVDELRMGADGEMPYVGFLKAPPSAAAAKAVAALSNEIDTLTIHGRELYWQCRKTLSAATVTGARIEKTLGVQVTFRNVTTVRKLAS